jgi:peptidoglycan/xylan/chitin deacetylase (PgdA/CDA1 family)
VLAILSYHKIGPPGPGAWPTWYHVAGGTLAAHLDLLEEGGWRVLDVTAALTALSRPESLRRRAALITFDDGYRSVLEHAAPLLAERGHPAVAFVPTAFVGGRSDWDADTHEPPEPICTWDEVRELHALGISIQSHGISHRPLSRLRPPELETELAGSKAQLEAELGSPVELFSFPYGDAGRDAAEVRAALVRAGYRGACLYGGGPLKPPVDDPFALPRIAVGADTDLAAALTGALPPATE